MDIKEIEPLFNLPTVDDGDTLRPSRVPAGFEDLSDGCTRAVLRKGDKVFKIGWPLVCEREVANVRRLRSDPDLPVWCYVPEAYMIADVEVMDFVAGEKAQRACVYGICVCGYRECWRVRARLLEAMYGLEDLHRGNFVIIPAGDDYIMAIYDLGDGHPDDWC